MEVLGSRLMLAVADFERSRAFYENVLGLRLYREYGAGRVLGVVFFTGGGFLQLSRGERPVTSDGLGLWLQVPDVATEEARLRAAGVVVRKPTELMPWGLLECWLNDPDGVDIRLIEVPPGHPLRSRVEVD